MTGYDLMREEAKEAAEEGKDAAMGALDLKTGETLNVERAAEKLGEVAEMTAAILPPQPIVMRPIPRNVDAKRTAAKLPVASLKGHRVQILTLEFSTGGSNPRTLYAKVAVEHIYAEKVIKALSLMTPLEV